MAKAPEANPAESVNKMVMPSYMQNTQVADDANSIASASLSIPRMSLKGKKFRFIEGGEESSRYDSVKVVILAVEPDAGHFIKTFYAGAYNPNDTAPPDCSSSNGIAPDSWVNDPQSPRCNTCPKNVFGSATSTSGKKAKACRDAKRLWVAKEGEVDGTVFGLNIPVTSLRSLADYGMYVKKNNFPLAGIVTELTMDEEAEFPQLIFQHVGFLPEEDFNTSLARNQEKDWMLNIPAGPMLEDHSKPEAKPKLSDVGAAVAEASIVKDVVSSEPTGDVAEKW